MVQIYKPRVVTPHGQDIPPLCMVDWLQVQNGPQCRAICEDLNKTSGLPLRWFVMLVDISTTICTCEQCYELLCMAHTIYITIRPSTSIRVLHVVVSFKSQPWRCPLSWAQVPSSSFQAPFKHYKHSMLNERHATSTTRTFEVESLAAELIYFHSI